MPSTLAIQPATPDQDPLIAQHFYHMWRDNQVPKAAIHPDWKTTTLNFIAEARATLQYQAFIAVAADQFVGSVGCQLYGGLYPNILNPNYRRDGYIWGVYVEPAYRCQGIASRLTEEAVTYLQALGCHRAILNASPPGKPVYERLGFEAGNLMQKSLTASPQSLANLPRYLW